MNAPRRWLEEGGSATPVERDLLRAGMALDPPPGAQDAIWGSIMANLPPPGGGGPSGGEGAAGKAAAGKAAAATKTAAVVKGGASSAGAAAGGGILTSALIGAGSAVVVIATYTVVTPSPPEPPPIHAPALAAEPSPTSARPAGGPHVLVPEPGATASASASAAPSADPRPAAEARPASSGAAEAPSADPSAARAADAAARETQLREESQQVGEARDALRRGDAAGALGLLEQIRARFPAGVLGQEREALSIEALARSGRRADAAARAAAFLQAYPQSPLAARVQTFAQ
jgi:hypothetical protein